MNSFSLIAIGQLAKDPELMSKENTQYTRFCLIANDYGGKERDGTVRNVVTSVWFVAFGPLGEAIALNARTGDQLIVNAQLRANNWIDRNGEKQYGYSYVAQGFRFGAPGKLTRQELGSRAAADIEPVEMGPESFEAHSEPAIVAG
jgi:single-stranded DNA-binding protein